jgi:hypothetical protein
MLLLSFVILFSINLIQVHTNKFTREWLTWKVE